MNSINGGFMISSFLIILLISQGLENKFKITNNINFQGSINKILNPNGFLVKQNPAINKNINGNQNNNINLFPCLDFNQNEINILGSYKLSQFKGKIIPIPLDCPNGIIKDIPLTWGNSKLILCDKSKEKQ